MEWPAQLPLERGGGVSSRQPEFHVFRDIMCQVTRGMSHVVHLCE